MKRRFLNVVMAGIVGIALSSGALLGDFNIAYASEAEESVEGGTQDNTEENLGGEGSEEGNGDDTEENISEGVENIENNDGQDNADTLGITTVEEAQAAIAEVEAEISTFINGLNDQQKLVDTGMKNEENARKAIANDNKKLNVDNYYREYGRTLALDMIKYNLISSGNVSAEDVKNGNVYFSDYYDLDYENRHYCVRYVDAAGELHEEYYDYVTCDENGKSIIRKSDTINYIGDNPGDVTGINVLVKTPVYSKTVTKKVTVAGKEFTVFQRTAFEKIDGSKKGQDYYTIGMYESDSEAAGQASAVVVALNNKLSELNAILENLNNVPEENLDEIVEAITILEVQIENLEDDLTDPETPVGEVQSQIDNLENELGNVEAIVQHYSAQEAKTNQTQTQSSSQESTAQSSSAQTSTSQETTQSAPAQTSASQEVAAPVVNVAFENPATEQVVIENFAPTEVTETTVMDEDTKSAAGEVAEIKTADNTVEIKNPEVPKAVIPEATGTWFFFTLPLIGIFTFFIVIFKRRKEEEEQKQRVRVTNR